MSEVNLILVLLRLALVGIVVYFLVGMIAMPDWAKRLCQGIVVLIFVLAAIQVSVGGKVYPEPHYPSLPSPQIMTPERGR